MSEPENRLFAGLRKGLLAQLGTLPFFAGPALPSNPHQMPFIETDPNGLKRVYTAPSIPEADLLRQILEEAGFHAEFVPSTGTGVFGITGNPCIYVPDAEYAEALAFLRDYLAATPEAPDAAPASSAEEPPV